MPKPAQERKVRIIGGNWRGRKVSFADDPQIRPSPDRVRETLFNWLQAEVAGARCLELYAGSGILSIEALSRGAASAVLVEQSAGIHQHLRQALAMLPITARFECLNSSAEAYLTAAATRQDLAFDLVFLDPPFASNELARVLPVLIDHHIVAEGGLIYIESAQPVDAAILPRGWRLYRQKQAGAVHYCLCERMP